MAPSPDQDLGMASEAPWTLRFACHVPPDSVGTENVALPSESVVASSNSGSSEGYSAAVNETVTSAPEVGSPSTAYVTVRSAGSPMYTDAGATTSRCVYFHGSSVSATARSRSASAAPLQVTTRRACVQ